MVKLLTWCLLDWTSVMADKSIWGHKTLNGQKKKEKNSNIGHVFLPG